MNLQHTIEQDFRELARREQVIVRTSVESIGANVALSACKAAVGLLSGSIAIVLDAVNNLSDAASSLITIVGTKLAAKAPDKRHPFGHGRIEYLTSMLISVIVLYAGLTSLIESVRKIIHPLMPTYDAVGLLLIAAAVVVKVFLGRRVIRIGKRVHSDSLINSGKDAALDAVISASTLAAALIYLAFDVSLEAWLAAVISCVIIKAGVDMLRETLSKVLGERADAELVRAIRETVLSFPSVMGVYDLVLNNYGPDSFNGSMHIEVPDTCTASDLDALIRDITLTVLQKHAVILTAVGVYAVNTSEEMLSMRAKVQETVMQVAHVTQMHGFYMDKSRKIIRFDLVVSFDAPDRRAVFDEACRRVEELFPGYSLQAVLDTDFSEG